MDKITPPIIVEENENVLLILFTKAKFRMLNKKKFTQIVIEQFNEV